MRINSHKHSFTFESTLELHNKHEEKVINPRNDICLEEFTNVFVEEGYLDDHNAKVMISIFLKGIKEDKITWKKDLLSLLTFIFLVDEFDSLTMPLTKKKREQYNPLPLMQ
jgi:hypothetical protein